MSVFAVSKEVLMTVIQELGKTHELHGPRVDRASGQVFFERAGAAEDIALEAELPSMPPKELFFPQVDRLLKYRYDSAARSVELTRLGQERPKALIGLRPCDLAAIQCLDRFFLGQEYVDEVYRTHRRKSFIVTYTCNEPARQCFCVCFHTGPAAEEGFDLNVTRLASGYLLEAGSEQGRALAVGLGLRPATEEQRMEKERVVERSIALFPEKATGNKAWASRVMNRVTTGFVKPEVWEEIGKKCFECGGCSYVCPTCSCFNVEDACGAEGECERLRTWDSCSLESYTRMAGDHNPRKLVEDRRNKRFFCKLSYSQSKKYLRPGCVGCGRCVWVCPGDIGLPSVVEQVKS
ncbi:MAG: 4Fe-4S dicluster domain-containing protein [Oligoflexia bacterium]|nr:4Fe-4S dicluster domain-containing protein [Oligoflexia bacterium]